jgi:hypothetical protein
MGVDSITQNVVYRGCQVSKYVLFSLGKINQTKFETEHETVVASNECDIEEIKRNACAQGVPLSEIAIFYDGLTDDEKDLMREQNLITHENGSVVIARFTTSGEVLFPEKVKGVHHLGA